MHKKIVVLTRTALLLLSFLIFFSCKQANKAKIDEIFNITLNIKVFEDDKFKVYYLEKEHSGYDEKNKVEVNVTGSNSYQDINFALSQLPHKFRIDLGESGIESKIWISGVTIEYKQQKIGIEDNALHRFFKPNIYLKRAQKGYIRKTIDNRYDPFLESTPLLEKKIELEF